MLKELLRQIERNSETQYILLLLNLTIHLFFALVYLYDDIFALHNREMFEFPLSDHKVDLPVT
jgi:hypothetical protein